MPFTDLLVIDCPQTGASPNARMTCAPVAGVFTSWQSLVAFPVATCVVATTTRAGRTIGRTDFDSIAMPLTAALVVGGAMLVATLMDQRTRPRHLRGWITSCAAALVNSLLLFAAALGIEKF